MRKLRLAAQFEVYLSIQQMNVNEEAPNQSMKL